MRYLAIDLGEKRTGIAIGDDEAKIVSPLDVIAQPAGEPILIALLKVIDQHRPKALVVGVPFNMDGTEGPEAMKTRHFGESLHTRTGLPVFYQDERLTSFAADERMARSGRTRKQKKQLRDALAAAEILQDFFDAKA